MPRNPDDGRAALIELSKAIGNPQGVLLITVEKDDPKGTTEIAQETLWRTEKALEILTRISIGVNKITDAFAVSPPTTVIESGAAAAVRELLEREAMKSLSDMEKEAPPELQKEVTRLRKDSAAMGELAAILGLNPDSSPDKVVREVRWVMDWAHKEGISLDPFYREGR